MAGPAKERQVRSADGTAIGFVELGSGPPLVIAHGSVSTAEHWLAVAMHLADRFTCHVMDRCGRGRSGDHPEHAIEREAEDIRAVLEAAGPGAHLLGHSYGAICTLEAARMAPPTRLVLYEPPLHIRATQANALATELGERIESGAREEALVHFLRQGPEIPDPEIDVLRRTPIWQQMVAVIHTVPREGRAIARIDADLERYRQLAMPVLLLVGRLSSKDLQDASIRLADVLADTHTLWLEDQAHVANLVAPDLVARGIAGFLSA